MRIHFVPIRLEKPDHRHPGERDGMQKLNTTIPPKNVNSATPLNQAAGGEQVRISKPASPFEQPLKSCGEVLETFVPALQEAIFVIQRALGTRPGGFRGERMRKLAGKIYAEFRVALKMLELAQAKMLHDTRRTAPRKPRSKVNERSETHVDRETGPVNQPAGAAQETAPHADRRPAALLAGAPTDGAPQTPPPLADRDAEVCAGD